MEQREYDEAIQQLQFAHDYDRRIPSIVPSLPTADTSTRTETKSSEALTELNETLRIDPHCGLVAYYSGVIHSGTKATSSERSTCKMLTSFLKGDWRPVESASGSEGEEEVGSRRSSQQTARLARQGYGGRRIGLLIQDIN